MKKYTFLLPGLLAFLFGLHANTAKAVPVRLGVISILSGSYAEVGQNIVDGINLAVAESSAEQKGTTFSIAVEDDRFEAATGISAFKKLTNLEKIDALINVSSPTIGAVTPLIRKSALPVIQIGVEAGEPLADSIFQLSPGAIPAERALGEFVYKATKDSIAVAYTENATFLRFVQAFKEGYGKDVSLYSITSVSDVPTIALKMVNQKPGMVVLFLEPQQGGMLVKEMLKLTSKSPVRFCFDNQIQTGIEEYKKILSNMSELNDACALLLNSTTSAAFKASFRKHFGRDAGLMAEYGYDAYKILAQTFSSNQKVWTENISNVRYEGASGLTTFDRVGVRMPEFRIGTVKELLESRH